MLLHYFLSMFVLLYFLDWFLEPGRPNKEYSSELGSQNDSEMEPQIYKQIIKKESTTKTLKNYCVAANYYT